MKQHITPKQASEVTFDEFKLIYMDDKLIKHNAYARVHAKKITIGKLIQFISDKCKYFEVTINDFGYEIHIEATTPFTSFHTDGETKGSGVLDGELVDVLWKIAKYLIGKG